MNCKFLRFISFIICFRLQSMEVVTYTPAHPFFKYPQKQQHWQPKGTSFFHELAIGNEDTIEALVSYNKSLAKCRNGWGWYPLHYTAYLGLFRSTQTLLNAGAEVNQPVGDTCETPFSIAAHNYFYGVAGLLLQHGANVDINDPVQLKIVTALAKNRPLVIAAIQRNYKCAQQFVKYPVSQETLRTAYRWTKKRGASDIQKLIEPYLTHREPTPALSSSPAGLLLDANHQ